MMDYKFFSKVLLQTDSDCASWFLCISLTFHVSTILSGPAAEKQPHSGRCHHDSCQDVWSLASAKHKSYSDGNKDLFSGLFLFEHKDWTGLGTWTPSHRVVLSALVMCLTGLLANRFTCANFRLSNLGCSHIFSRLLELCFCLHVLQQHQFRKIYTFLVLKAFFFIDQVTWRLPEHVSPLPPDLCHHSSHQGAPRWDLSICSPHPYIWEHHAPPLIISIIIIGCCSGAQ